MGWRAAAVLAVVGLLVAGCGADPATVADEGALTPTSASAGPNTPPPATTPPAPTGAVIATGPSEFGPMLFDDRGQAIYLFDQEPTSEPACYDDCAESWPPVLTDGAPQPAGDARGDLLGTTTRADGTTQVTYAGHPLYFYAHEDPGEVLCHDVFLNGGTWYVVTPEGEPGPA